MNKKIRTRVLLFPFSFCLAAHGIGADGDAQAADVHDPGDPGRCTGSAQHGQSRVQRLLLLLVLLLQLLMVLCALIQASGERSSRGGR